MKLRRKIALFVLLLAATAWAGGTILGNPSNLRPQQLSAANSSRPLWQRTAATSPRTGRKDAQRAPGASGAVVAARGIGVDGAVFNLTLPVGFVLTDPLPVPTDLLADLEIDLADGSTITVAIDDPDAAAAAGAVLLDGAANLSVEAWMALPAEP